MFLRFESHDDSQCYSSVITLLFFCDGILLSRVKVVSSLSSLLSAPLISAQVSARLGGALRKAKPLSQTARSYFFVKFLPELAIEDIFQNQKMSSEQWIPHSERNKVRKLNPPRFDIEATLIGWLATLPWEEGLKSICVISCR